MPQYLFTYNAGLERMDLMGPSWSSRHDWAKDEEAIHSAGCRCGATDRTVHVAVEGVCLLRIFLIAVGPSWVIRKLEEAGVVPTWMTQPARLGQTVIGAIDIFAFAAFVLYEVATFTRQLWLQWKTPMAELNSHRDDVIINAAFLKREVRAGLRNFIAPLPRPRRRPEPSVAPHALKAWGAWQGRALASPYPAGSSAGICPAGLSPESIHRKDRKAGRSAARPQRHP